MSATKLQNVIKVLLNNLSTNPAKVGIVVIFLLNLVSDRSNKRIGEIQIPRLVSQRCRKSGVKNMSFNPKLLVPKYFIAPYCRNIYLLHKRGKLNRI